MQSALSWAGVQSVLCKVYKKGRLSFASRVLGFVALLLLSQLPTQTALGACRVSTGALQDNYYGYPIDFQDATLRLLQEKGYDWVEQSVADFHLEIGVATELRGRFQTAVARATFTRVDAPPRATVTGDLQWERSKRCLGMLCALRDFAKPLVELFADLNEQLPACGEN